MQYYSMRFSTQNSISGFFRAQVGLLLVAVAAILIMVERRSNSVVLPVVGVQALSLNEPSSSSSCSISSSSTAKKNRREFLSSTASIVGGTVAVAGVGVGFESAAQATTTTTNSLPFCVIGANGKTGTKCVQDIFQRGFPVRATSRSGIYNDQEVVESEVDDDSNDTNSNPQKNKNSLLIPTICDVTNPSTIESAIVGSRAVIFAASAKLRSIACAKEADEKYRRKAR